jgi:hypothetical protein
MTLLALIQNLMNSDSEFSSVLGSHNSMISRTLDSVEENDDDGNVVEQDINNSLLHGGEISDGEDDDDCEDGDDNALKKFNNSVKNDLISQFHIHLHHLHSPHSHTFSLIGY